jgi:hypothetical protein
MPRKSAEERGALAYRTALVRPPPPRHLDQRARHLFGSISASRAPGYFSGVEHQLAVYAGLMSRIEAVMAELVKARPGTVRAGRLGADLKTLSPIAAAHARQLRISVNSRTSSNSGILDERGLGQLQDDELIGGAARNVTPLRRPR